MQAHYYWADLYTVYRYRVHVFPIQIYSFHTQIHSTNMPIVMIFCQQPSAVVLSKILYETNPNDTHIAYTDYAYTIKLSVDHDDMRYMRTQ